MKQSLLLFFFVRTNAQDNRWMYLTTGNDSTTYMVDTLANDYKQLDSYDTHNNVVLIWIKSIPKKVIKDEVLNEWSIVHVAIDTTNNQIEVKSAIAYKDGSVVKNANSNYPNWVDIVPESIGDAEYSYCRALHNKKIMFNLVMKAYWHDLVTHLPKKTN